MKVYTKPVLGAGELMGLRPGPLAPPRRGSASVGATRLSVWGPTPYCRGGQRLRARGGGMGRWNSAMGSEKICDDLISLIRDVTQRASCFGWVLLTEGSGVRR